MDETLVCWIFLLFTAVLMSVQQPTRFGMQVQKFLHSGGNALGLCFQWYTLLMVGLGYLLLRTFYDIVVFDYVKYHFLSREFFGPALNQTIHAQLIYDPDNYPDEEAVQNELKELVLQGPIKVVAMCSPVVGMIAAGVVVYTVFNLVLSSRDMWRTRFDTEGEFYWALNHRMNMVIMVVLTPLVFIVMAMRSTLRQWAVMTGSAYAHYLQQIQGGETPSMTWEEVKNLELATYETDLELANFFQFVTIASFGYLCGVFLSRSHYLNLDVEQNDSEEVEVVKKQYRRTLQWLSIQGLFAYVVVGALRTLISLVATVMKENPRLQGAASNLEVNGLHSTDKVFIFVTICCVINMQFIGKMKDVRDHLGKNVNMKFMGTRLLLLIAQMQLKILAAFTIGSVMYARVKTGLEQEKQKHGWIAVDINDWAFGQNKAQLLHSSLLVFESLLVVIANSVLWKLDDQQMLGLLKGPVFGNSASSALLTA